MGGSFFYSFVDVSLKINLVYITSKFWLENKFDCTKMRIHFNVCMYAVFDQHDGIYNRQLFYLSTKGYI